MNELTEKLRYYFLKLRNWNAYISDFVRLCNLKSMFMKNQTMTLYIYRTFELLLKAKEYMLVKNIKVS